MGKIFHISQYDPREHAGGVAQFARDLKLALPDLEFLAHDIVHRPWDSVEAMNQRYLSDGVISRDDTVIADGYYGLGLAGKVARLIVVAHGTYAGWLRDTLANPTPAGESGLEWLYAASTYQERAYMEADQIVAVSTGAAAELDEFYGLPSTVILNGIDTDRYTPSEEDVAIGSIVAVDGGDANKGADVIAGLIEDGVRIDQLGFEGDKWSRWIPYEVALLPSRHEAGPYAQLEAMAMNKKIVCYPSGLFKLDAPRDLVWWSYDLYWRTFKRLIEDAMASEPRDTRQWVLDNATIDLFKKKWGEFINERYAH